MTTRGHNRIKGTAHNPPLAADVTVDYDKLTNAEKKMMREVAHWVNPTIIEYDAASGPPPIMGAPDTTDTDYSVMMRILQDLVNLTLHNLKVLHLAQKHTGGAATFDTCKFGECGKTRAKADQYTLEIEKLRLPGDGINPIAVLADVDLQVKMAAEDWKPWRGVDPTSNPSVDQSVQLRATYDAKTGEIQYFIDGQKQGAVKST